MNMGRAGPKNDDGTESPPTYPTISFHGEGEPPDLTDGPYHTMMSHKETHVTTDDTTGKKTHHVVMAVHKMKPMADSPQMAQGPKALTTFSSRKIMDAGADKILKSKVAPGGVTTTT